MRQAEDLGQGRSRWSIGEIDSRPGAIPSCCSGTAGQRYFTFGSEPAVAFSRSAAATARLSRDLAKYGDGRFVLGLDSHVGPNACRETLSRRRSRGGAVALPRTGGTRGLGSPSPRSGPTGNTSSPMPTSIRDGRRRGRGRRSALSRGRESN